MKAWFLSIDFQSIASNEQEHQKGNSTSKKVVELLTRIVTLSNQKFGRASIVWTEHSVKHWYSSFSNHLCLDFSWIGILTLYLFVDTENIWKLLTSIKNIAHKTFYHKIYYIRTQILRDLNQSCVDSITQTSKFSLTQWHTVTYRQSTNVREPKTQPTEYNLHTKCMCILMLFVNWY